LEFAYTDKINQTTEEKEIIDFLSLAKLWGMPDLINLIAQKYPFSFLLFFFSFVYLFDNNVYILL